MKTLLKTILVGAALAVAAVAMAAGAADSVAGTWSLNVAKSTFDPGPALKSQTRTYTVDKDGTTVSVKGVGADGSAMYQQATFKYDGKAYPFTGSADFDAIALKQVNDSTVKSTLMKAGKRVGTATRTVSGHGKMLTLSTKVTGADGKVHTTALVFDKQ
jgi:streptogramin lyase